MNEKYGKIRKEDLDTVKKAVKIFHKHKLNVGLHGTSLWNHRYKDIDMLVTSKSNKAKHFLDALEELKHVHGIRIVEERGDKETGLDYYIEIGTLVLHLSYVVLL